MASPEGIPTNILAERDIKTERRQTNRRRLMRAGMLALLGAAGAKAHILTRTHLLSDPASADEAG